MSKQDCLSGREVLEGVYANLTAGSQTFPLSDVRLLVHESGDKDPLREYLTYQVGSLLNLNGKPLFLALGHAYGRASLHYDSDIFVANAEISPQSPSPESQLAHKVMNSQYSENSLLSVDNNGGLFISNYSIFYNQMLALFKSRLIGAFIAYGPKNSTQFISALGEPIPEGNYSYQPSLVKPLSARLLDILKTT